MSRKHSNHSRSGHAQESEDLKLITGIGPVVEKRLHAMGIDTFSQLAALTPADLAASLSDIAGLTAERIIKQDWIGQARKLAAHSSSPEALKKIGSPIDTELTKRSQRAETFSIELRLDENDEVLSTYIKHIQSGQEHKWSGWSKIGIIDFLIQSSQLTIPSEELEYAKPEVTQQTHLSGSKDERETHKETRMIPPLNGKLLIRYMEIVGIEHASPRQRLSHDLPLIARVTLDFTEMKLPLNTTLRYKSSMYCKSKGSSPSNIVKVAEGNIHTADKVTVNIEGDSLQIGTYQIAATIMLGLPGTKLTPKSDTMAIIDGGLIEVY